MIEKTSQTYEDFTAEVLSELNSKRKNGEITEAMYKEAALHLHAEQGESHLKTAEPKK